MAQDPSTFIEPLDVFAGRTSDYTFDCYTETGDPLVIATDDQVRAKIWSTDSASPEIEAYLTSTNSKVTVNDYGSVGATPARVTVRLHQTDTGALVSTTAYKFELLLVDKSDSSLAKTICRADVVVSGSAAGSLGL